MEVKTVPMEAESNDDVELRDLKKQILEEVLGELIQFIA